jgi:hypothetical protein
VAFTSSDDPFVVLESTSNPAYTSTELFSDPLEQISKLNSSGGTRPGISSNAIPSLRPPPKPTQVSNADKGSYCFLKLIKKKKKIPLQSSHNLNSWDIVCVMQLRVRTCLQLMNLRTLPWEGCEIILLNDQMYALVKKR